MTDPWGWKDWLIMVGHLTLPEIRCDVPPTEEILGMIDAVGLDQWETYSLRLERKIVKERWTWPERSKDGEEA